MEKRKIWHAGIPFSFLKMNRKNAFWFQKAFY
jgi:hypothetical protein